MTKPALILDLDDTIFRTRSMDAAIFSPFFNCLHDELKPHFGHDTIQLILNDLWKDTWDRVMDRYKVPLLVFTRSIKELEALELDLNISVYDDYHFLKTLNMPKYLVTSSLTSLQQAKIKALGIGSDFEKIVINDAFIEQRTKLDVFKNLVNEFGLVPQNTYVVGDNNDSEIVAGNALGMVTIQILREGVVKGPQAKHHIFTFNELSAIINA